MKQAFVGMLCSLLVHFYAFAQPTSADRLVAQLRTLPADTNRVHTLNALAEAYRNSEPYRAMRYAQQADTLATRLHFQKGKATARDHIGWGYYRLGELDKALSFSMEALRLSQAAGDKSAEVNATINVASIYYEQNNYAQAISYFDRAWRMSQTLGDQRITGRALNNLGFLYFKQGNYPLSLDYSFKALRHNEQLADQYLISYSLRNIGDVYTRQGHYTQAIGYLSRSLEAARAAGNKYTTVTALNRLGDVYALLANYPKAIHYQQQALALSKQAGLRPDLVNVYKSLSEIYFRTGDFKNAHHYQQLGGALKDSIYNENSSQRIAQLQARFETERKEQENRLLRSENEKKQALIRQQYWSGVAGLAILLLLIGTSLFLFLAYRQKKKVNQVLESQKTEIEAKNHQLIALNQEVNDQNQELERLNRIKNQLLSLISHDVRAPLRSIHGVLNLARMDQLSMQELQSLLDKLTGQVQHTSLLLDNLLNWSRFQMNGVQASKTSLDLQAIAAETLELYQPLAEKKFIHLYNAIAEPVWVPADVEMIKTVLRNLVSNAIKFTHPRGTITLRIRRCTPEEQPRIAAQPTENGHWEWVQFTVEDTGIGIQPAELNQLFSNEPHSTLGTSLEKGTGLGLKVCRDFVHQHQGRIWAESKPGQGTSFHFTLPFSPEDSLVPQA